MSDILVMALGAVMLAVGIKLLDSPLCRLGKYSSLPKLSKFWQYLPIAQSAGINTVQFGIMMILNCGIGLLTPPVGSVLFIGSAISKRPMEKIVKASLPFYLCMIAALLLISFIPQLSLWLPEVTGALK